jgi:glycosyltransferase involved in cell wall biosynthesis
VAHVAGAPRTLVIIPAYNEEAALPGVLADLAARAPGLDVLVVDDGSTDRTAAVARAAGAVVARLPFNLGIGGALRAGFRYAVRRGYDRAVQFDADGQHDAGEIPRLLAALDDGADLVIGSRFADKSVPYDVGRTRRLAMRVLHLGVRALSGRRFTDTSSGFRAFSRPMLERFAASYPVDYMDSVEALLLALAAGMRVEEVPVRMRVRVAGAPSNRSFKLVYHYLRLLVVMATSAGRRSRRPSEVT